MRRHVTDQRQEAGTNQKRNDTCQIAVCGDRSEHRVFACPWVSSGYSFSFARKELWALDAPVGGRHSSKSFLEAKGRTCAKGNSIRNAARRKFSLRGPSLQLGARRQALQWRLRGCRFPNPAVLR